MGEHADDMVEGTVCSDCGMFFRDPMKHDHVYTHGFPVICRDCWNDYTPAERAQARKNGMQVAHVKTV